MPTTSRDRFTSPTQATARFVAQRGLLKAVTWRVVTVTVEGRENLGGLTRPFVAVANHSSHLDAPLILGALPRPLARYLAAGAAGDYFFDVWWRRGLTALFFNAFPVDRRGARTGGVDARALIERGVPVLLFPEGTRSRDGTIGRFKPGSAALAAATGAPVLPIAIIGAHDAHPRGSNWPKRGRLPVTVVFGAPMRSLDDESSVAFMARVREAIVALVDHRSPRILSASNVEGES